MQEKRGIFFDLLHGLEWHDTLGFGVWGSQGLGALIMSTGAMISFFVRINGETFDIALIFLAALNGYRYLRWMMVHASIFSGFLPVI